MPTTIRERLPSRMRQAEQREAARHEAPPPPDPADHAGRDHAVAIRADFLIADRNRWQEYGEQIAESPQVRDVYHRLANTRPQDLTPAERVLRAELHRVARDTAERELR